MPGTVELRRWLLATVWLLLTTGPGRADELAVALATLRAGRPEAAVAQLDRLLAATPQALSARYWRAVAQAELGRWSAVATDLAAVLTAKPDSDPSRVLLVEALARLGQAGEATAALAELRQRSPRHPDLPRLTALVATSSPLVGRRDERLGRHIGLVDDGLVGWSPDGLAVAGSRLYDYTFAAAPTDWEPVGGEWSVSSRYACDPDWSFFGGHSLGLCSVWNKRVFAGDLVVEAYVAPKHGLPWAPEAWQYVPHDLNINLFSQRGDLSSGYSFIYSGRGGQATLIRRGATILAETSDPAAVLPPFLDGNPLFQVDEQGQPFGQFHRHWWRLTARRQGHRVSLEVDGKEILAAHDPHPPASGQVALWTFGSGFVIARLRLAYQAELPPAGRDPLWRSDEPAALPSVR